MARATTKKQTLAAGGYVGKEKLTIARRENGTQVYVWRGQPVPADIPAAEVLRLAERGYIVAKEVKKAPARQAPASSEKPAESAKTEGEQGEAVKDAGDKGDGNADA